MWKTEFKTSVPQCREGMQSNSLNMKEQNSIGIFISIYLSSSFLKFYLMVVHNGNKVFLHVYYITDVSSYIHICANIYTMCITCVHNVRNFLYITKMYVPKHFTQRDT